MKRTKGFLWIVLCLSLLAGCTVSGSAGDCTVGEPSFATEEVDIATFRVVDERNGSLLLAKDDGERWDVFTVSLGDTFLTLDGEAFDLGEPGAYQELPGRHLEGALVEIVYGSVQETYPAHLAEVFSINILTEGFDDRCALYSRVLDDLWETDPALNADITTVSINLTQTDLTPGEWEAVAMAFSWDHGISEYLTLGYAELEEQGYLDCADENCSGMPHWEDGVLLSIAEKTEQTVGTVTEADMSGSTENELIFDAVKWRSALGAYIFSDCTSARDSDGHWDGYTVGAGMIS